MHRGEQRLALRAAPQSAVRYGSVGVESEEGRREPAAAAGAHVARRAARVRCFGALVLALAVGAAPQAAFAQDEDSSSEEGSGEEEAPSEPPSEVTLQINEAKAQIDRLDYPAAQQTLFGVVQSGKATSAELAEAYFNLGIVEAALGNDVEATDSFYLSLMIEPSSLFPEGGSPKIRERLNEARGRVTEVGVLQLRGIVRDGVLDVYLDNDPLKLVRRIDVMMTREDGESGRVTLEKGAMRAEVEPGVKSIQVAVYDEAGNQLKVVDVDPASGSPSTTPAVLEQPSVWESWGLWAGVAGAFAIGGTYFMMEASSLDSDIQAAVDDGTNPAEVRRLQDNQDRVGLYGVIGLSLAGAAAVASGALLLFGGDDDEAGTEESATVMPTFAPGHVGANFKLTF